jgi:hypothetical protein
MRDGESSLGAEAYPPLWPKVVYPHEPTIAMAQGKKDLTFAALSDISRRNGQGDSAS